MKCRLLQGDVTLHQNARLVCSDFTSTLATSDTLKFAVKVINPASVAISSASVPLTIYSYDPLTGRKDNFQLYENAVQLGTV
jgi:hypothetical protein